MRHLADILRHLLTARVPRYLLLLNALLKRTDPDHKDYNNIQKAAQQVLSLPLPSVCLCVLKSHSSLFVITHLYR